MSRGSKIVKVDEHQILVKELQIKHALGIMNCNNKAEIVQFALGVREDLISGITQKIFLEFSGTDLKKIWDAFKELNANFSILAKEWGLEGILPEIIKALRQTLMLEFTGFLSTSLQEDIREFLNTPSATSCA